MGSLFYLLFLCLVCFKASSQELKQALPNEKSYYVGASFGAGDFSKTNDVKGDRALGFFIGKKMSREIKAEFTYIHSTYNLTESRCSSASCSSYYEPIEISMKQQNFGLGAKYVFGRQSVSPYLGTGLHYVVRDFSNRRTYYRAGSSIDSLPRSWSVQLGLEAGAIAEISDSFQLIGAVIYFSTLKGEREGDPKSKGLSGQLYDAKQSIEDLDSYLFAVGVSYLF